MCSTPVMKCSLCDEEAVYVHKVDNKAFCSKHFIRFVERKINSTINKYNMVREGDKVAVALSGGKDSMITLHLLNRYCKRRRIQIFAVMVDEGIPGYREKIIDDVKDYCRRKEIPLYVYSFRKEFGYTLPEMLDKIDAHPCSVCAVLKRWLINKKSRELGATRLATGHNLDDEAQSFLMNVFRGDILLSSRLGPVTGVLSEKKFVRRIKPLYFIPEDAVGLYSKLIKLPVLYDTCPLRKGAYRLDVMHVLNEFERKHPDVKYKIVKGFLDILPILKNEYISSRTLNYCKKCGEPSVGEVCMACQILEKLS